MSSQDPEDRGAADAYDEVCRSYERIDDFRAKLLGLLPLASGTGLLFLIKTPEGSNVASGVEIFAFAGTFGFVVTIGLLFYELRGIQRCIRLAKVGASLERQMGVQGRFAMWPESVGRIINEPVAAGFIYAAVLASWSFLAIRVISVMGAIIAASVVFATAFAAVFRFYLHVRKDMHGSQGASSN
jgi:hypothetical protein